MNFFLPLVCVFFFLTSSIFSASETTKLHLKGMACAYSCVDKVKNVTSDLKGVESVQVSFEKKQAIVTHDDSLTAQDLVDLLNKNTEYSVSLIIEEDTNPAKKKRSFFSWLFG